MQVTREDLNSCTVRLNVVCSAEQVTDAFDRAIKAIAKEVRIPGFRPGHAPKQMVEKMVNEQELYSQAADILVQRTFSKAVEEQKIQPDTGVRPSVELQNLDREGKTGTYSAKVPLPPKIELSEYKGLAATQPPSEVTEEEVEFQNYERSREAEKRSLTEPPKKATTEWSTSSLTATRGKERISWSFWDKPSQPSTRPSWVCRQRK